MVASEDYQLLFPGTRLDRRSDASDEFATSEGGLYLAVGMTGSFMGTGANLLIVDDPFKSRAAAESPTIRRRVMSSYDDLENRLEPGAVVVVMHTRWHEADLVGNIETTRIRTGIEKWHRITSPMIANECPQWEQVEACERGTAENEQDAANQRDADAYEIERALWPEHYDIDACRAIRRRVPQRTWVSLYQQRPSSEQGGFFLRESIQRFAPTADETDGGQPSNLNLYLACDYGVTEDGDRTEIYLVGIDERNHWWVLECWKGSVSSDVWCGALVDLVVEHRPHAVAGEAGVIRRAVEPFITLMMDESRAATVFLWASRGSNKSACAVGLQGIASMRRLHVAYGNWGDELVAALVAFPTSDDDHGVDALANLSLCMEQTPGAFALPVDGGHNRRDKWAEAFRRARSDAASGWKTT